MRPFNELTEQERWFEMACSCMGCGLRQDPLPAEPVPWMCDNCNQEWERYSCGCPDCKAKDAEVGNGFTHTPGLDGP